jgi:predicted metallo-beta-lactamase superfamily hydrolase
MEILPLAFESLGTRSMCTFVKTKNKKILIDPGVSLAPYRFKLEPHPIEIQEYNKQWGKILEYSTKADIIIITHYHYDHFNPFEFPEIYENKFLLIKHPENNINFSQKKRAKQFLKIIKGKTDQIKYSDGREFEFGKTKIKFSSPVFHGISSKLGFVLEVLIDDGYKFIHTSDIQGSFNEDQINFIIENNPNFLIIDGPSIYLMNNKYSKQDINRSIKNMVRILRECSLEYFIIDHHSPRLIDWQASLKDVFDQGNSSKTKVLSAAEYLNVKENLLEAKREELYEKFPIENYPNVEKFIHP